MLKRFKLVDIVQSNPYKIGRCEEYLDLEILSFKEADQKTNKAREELLAILNKHTGKLSEEVLLEIADLEKEKTINDFTFKAFKFFRFPEIFMQEILNSKDPLFRLTKLHESVLSIPDS